MSEDYLDSLEKMRKQISEYSDDDLSEMLMRIAESLVNPESIPAELSIGFLCGEAAVRVKLFEQLKIKYIRVTARMN
jgi:hypothetical protein